MGDPHIQKGIGMLIALILGLVIGLVVTRK